ncbi:zinc finger protein ZF(C2H2)-75 isoform X1 [Ciona intestinalis]
MAPVNVEQVCQISCELKSDALTHRDSVCLNRQTESTKFVTRNRNNACPFCGKAYTNEVDLHQHMTLHTSRLNDSIVTWATKRKKTGRARHVNKVPGVRPHMCDTCGKRFSLLENMHRHQLIHSNDRPFKCPHCSKNFRLSQHLKEHIRIHTGEKPFKCDICGHAFCQISNLKSHQKTHSKEKSFSCDTCGKGFRRSFTLKQHKLIHQRNKLFNSTDGATKPKCINKMEDTDKEYRRDESYVFTSSDQSRKNDTMTSSNAKSMTSNLSDVAEITSTSTVVSPTWSENSGPEFFGNQAHGGATEMWPELNALARLTCQQHFSHNRGHCGSKDENNNTQSAQKMLGDYKWKRDLSREWICDERIKIQETNNSEENLSPVSMVTSQTSCNVISNSEMKTSRKISFDDESRNPWLLQENHALNNLAGFVSVPGIPPPSATSLVGYNPFGLVPMVEWQPVITGWRSMLDGSVYAVAD